MKKLIAMFASLTMITALVSCEGSFSNESSRPQDEPPQTVVVTVYVTPEPEEVRTAAPEPEKTELPAEITDAPAPETKKVAENTDPRIGTPFDRKVVVSDASAGIYLRPEPDLNAEWLALIPKNTIVTCYSCSTPGWFYTTYDGKSGYIYAEYTKDPGTAAQSSSRTYIGEGRVNVSAASAGIYLRPYANLNAEWLTLIPKNQIISLYSCDSSDWYYTYYDGKEGYVYADYVSRDTSVYSYNNYDSSFAGYGVVTVSAASAGIYLRPYCDLDAEWLLLIPKNTSIPLYYCSDSDWYYTTYDGVSGYVYADYVKR